MIEAFSQMLWPLLACFVLVGIHAYLGIHVIARKVIFVDLALAQIAALGAVYGVFIGLSFEADPWAIKAVSVIFTLFGAVLFAFTRTPDERVPHEAIIGIIYAAALSMTLLMTANLPHGADEVRQMLAGSILWVTPYEVMWTAALYSAVGLVHFIFRKQFFWLSHETALSNSARLNIKFWDFLFYATFGVVVTSSVGIGGVLLVFGYLVIPAVIGVMLAESTKMRLFVSWASGILVSICGVVISYYLDLPTGPTIVVLLGGLLVLITLLLEIRTSKSRRSGFFHAGLLLGIFLLLVLVPSWINHFIESRRDESKTRLHLLTHDSVRREEQIKLVKASLLSKDDDEITRALSSTKENKMVEVLPDIVPLLSSSDDKIRVQTLDTLRLLNDERAITPIMNALGKETDVFIKIEMAQALLGFGQKDGLLVLEEIASRHTSEFAQSDALSHLVEWLKNAPPSPTELSVWLEKNYAKIIFNKAENKYYVP